MCAKAAKMIWNKRVLIEGPQTPKIVPFPTPPQPYLPKDDLFVEVLKKGANQ